MDKYYYFNLYKYGCIKLAGVNVEPEHVYNYVLEKYNESRHICGNVYKARQRT